nr:hypothetical protein [Thermoplasmata archaeon]NIS13598.1 hypothetical protein [Thermoplasmata archaeon]NIS21467.1 hypothetical protein [Thermoplasmata archaeon]NIT79031.1 hypothetical protein [Thermoplasmata archaeon]NIU50516.1 hypothetical protein [Thermoplasmata archaeon]
MTDVAPFAVVQAASIVVILVLAGLYVTAPEDPHTNGLVDIRFKDPPGSGSGPGNNTTDPPDNLPPVVEAGDPVSTLAGRVTVLEGIAIDQDGRIALYEWDFDGDGEFDWSNATSGKGQWTYARTGGYTAVLRVTDDEGAHGEDTVRVSVLSPPGNLEPIAYAGEDRVVEQGEEVEFYMTGNDFDGTLVLFEWDYDGDGTYDDNSTLVRITYHTYQVPGNYTALLRVTDDQGATSVDTRTIIVTERAVNLPPVVDAGPDVEVEIGEKVQLAGTAYDPDGVVEE